jgi:hypothetical protein
MLENTALRRALSLAPDDWRMIANAKVSGYDIQVLAGLHLVEVSKSGTRFRRTQLGRTTLLELDAYDPQDDLDLLAGTVQHLEDADRQGLKMSVGKPGDFARCLRRVLSQAFPDVN